ncbi:hypothetical protein QU38_02090, partial [Staphylococcus aureus]
IAGRRALRHVQPLAEADGLAEIGDVEPGFGQRRVDCLDRLVPAALVALVGEFLHRAAGADRHLGQRFIGEIGPRHLEFIVHGVGEVADRRQPLDQRPAVRVGNVEAGVEHRHLAAGTLVEGIAGLVDRVEFREQAIGAEFRLGPATRRIGIEAGREL